MNTTTLNLRNPVERSVPRGATWIGQVAAAVAHVFTAAPRPADARDASRDARKARAIAAEWSRRDPRGAADLSAAIDRYEEEHGL